MDIDGDGIDDGGGHGFDFGGHHGFDGWGDFDGFGDHHGFDHHGGWGGHMGYHGLGFDHDTGVAAGDMGRVLSEDGHHWCDAEAIGQGSGKPSASFGIKRGMALIMVFPHDFCGTQGLFEHFARKLGGRSVASVVPGFKADSTRQMTFQPGKEIPFPTKDGKGSKLRGWHPRFTTVVTQWKSCYEIREPWYKRMWGTDPLDTPDRTHLVARGWSVSYPDTADCETAIEIGVYSKSFVVANIELFRWARIRDHLKAVSVIGPQLMQAISARVQRQESRDLRKRWAALWGWHDQTNGPDRGVPGKIEEIKRRGVTRPGSIGDELTTYDTGDGK